MSSVRFRRVCAGLTGVLAAGLLTPALTGPADAASNPITPGNITGKGFDQCNAPTQKAMDVWRQLSPYRAAGIYISGRLRFCDEQPNLTPTWVRTQLATGWKLLPIHVGRQAACTGRDRYQAYKISADPADGYATARSQGRTEADIATRAARDLGLVAKSTIFYDLEAFSIATAACRNSTLWFLSAWTDRIRANGYTSGVYSSAASGIKLLDDARVDPDSRISLPYHLWIADWDGQANTSSEFVRPDGWPNRRLKQYRGGHNETYGGVTINIDTNYLDLQGGPSTLPGPATPELADPVRDPVCTTGRINQSSYGTTDKDSRTWLHVPLQCLLKQRGLFEAEVTGYWARRTLYGIHVWQQRVGHRVKNEFNQADWVSLLVGGNRGSWLTTGVRGADVIRVQRALHAAGFGDLHITGTFDSATARAVKGYQKNVGLPVNGKVGAATWHYLERGRLWRAG